jgi:thiamine kinase
MNIDPVVWQEALAQVPGATAGGEVRVQPLAGGATNATFRVGTVRGAFVVRLHQSYSADLGVDRRREAVLHQAAAVAGLASRVLAADPQGRFLVTEFIEGAPWQARDMEDETRLGALAQSLSELHALPAPAVPRLDLGDLLARHVAGIAGQDAGVARELKPRLARAADILARQADACIVHGDLSHGNLIGADPLRLIDWEYATVADPLADLACLAAYYPQVLAHGTALLERCGLSGSVSVVQLADFAWVYRLLSDLWFRRVALARRHPPPAH